MDESNKPSLLRLFIVFAKMGAITFGGSARLSSTTGGATSRICWIILQSGNARLE